MRHQAESDSQSESESEYECESESDSKSDWMWIKSGDNMCRELHLQSRHQHTHIERYSAYNEWLCVWNPYNAVNWVLPPLPLFTFTDYTLHHAKQQQQQQEQQIDDMFGQFIIMRKSKFENIAGVAGVCQKLLPTFRRCLKNEKGVANWNWVNVCGRGTVCLPAPYRTNVSAVDCHPSSSDCKIILIQWTVKF